MHSSISFMALCVLTSSIFGDDQLTGYVVPNSTSDHFFIESDGIMYRVASERLSKETKENLSAHIGRVVHGVSVMPAVDWAWRVNGTDEDNIEILSLNCPKKAGTEEGVITGKVATAFKPGEFMIHAGEMIYQLNESALSAPQKRALENAVGSSVSLRAKPIAIANLWMTTQPETNIKESPRALASFPGVAAHYGRLSIKGRVMPSFDTNRYLIQTGDHILQVKKEAVEPEVADLLGGVGRLVSIFIPVEAISYSWTSEKAEGMK